MSAQENPVYRFADCELDPRERRLTVRGLPVTLTPKVFDTLVLLVERAGHVVSKDELMAALWPRGFVHESNLTKHIWLIRRALGEGEDDDRCIETVPKLGYRFVAPVQRVAGAETSIGNSAPEGEKIQAPPDASPASGATTLAGVAAPAPGEWVAGRDPERRNGRASPADYGQAIAANMSHGVPAIRLGDRVRLTAIGLIMVALAGALYWWRMAAAPTVPASVSGAGAVAIVDFNNLSGNAKDAWLGPALEQMLATEVAANGKLHAVSEELVRPARADLPAPGAGGYSPSSLTVLQHRLGAHYVLSGAYLISGATDAPQLRVDLTIQDAQSGAMFASLSRSAAVDDLPQLVSQVGGELRKRFGESSSNPEMLKQIAAAQPPTAEVARHVGFALQALGQYDAARARDELLQAIAQSPGYALAYLYLSHAWSMLGYRAKALAAAEQAAADARDLPEEERLQIDAQQADLQVATAQSIAIHRKLVALRPQNPEYRLRLIGAQIMGGKNDAAESALAQARKLSAFAGDPRLELAAAQLASARADAKAYIAHAREALRLAQARGESGLIAQAELQLGVALDLDKQAEPMLRQASADFHRIGNPHGEAQAYQNLGNLMDGRNRMDAARENYERAMAIYQGVGDLGGEAAVYDDLSRMLWNAGDRDGTEAALRQALAIGRETNDMVRQAWSLTGLATTLTDESASDEAKQMYVQAIALDEQAGAHAHKLLAQTYYADLLRMRGELDRARDVCADAQRGAKTSGGSSMAITSDFECAQIALDRGDVDSATASLKQNLQSAIASKDTFATANARLVLGQIAMGKQQWPQARDALLASLQGWTASQETGGEATTEGLLAITYNALGDPGARDKSAADARALRSRITQHAEVAPLDIAMAFLQGQTGDRDAAIAKLQSIADDANRRRWVGIAMEARLAAVQLMQAGRDQVGARAARDALGIDAHKAGFGWVAQRVAMTQASPAH